MISVIIPFSEDQTYLIRCVNAVRRQTYKDVQLLLVAENRNEAVRQCVLEVLENSSEQRYGLEVIESGGQHYGGINEAISRADGEYLYFSNVTSVPAPNTLEVLLKEYEAERNILKYGQCYVEKTQGFEACEGMQVSIYGKLYDMKLIREKNIQFRENSVFAEIQFIAEYAAHMDYMDLLENIYIYETDLQWNWPKNTDEEIDAADWKALLEGINRLNEAISRKIMEPLCEYVENYPVYSREVLDITKEDCDNTQLQYIVAKAASRFWWKETLQRHNQEAFESLKVCLAGYEENKKYLELLLMVCGIQKEEYPYLNEKDLQAALYFMSERSRLKEHDERKAEVTVKKQHAETVNAKKLDAVKSNAEICVEMRKELAGAELAEYTVSKYASGKLGFRTLFSSLRAWIKYKF